MQHTEYDFKVTDREFVFDDLRCLFFYFMHASLRTLSWRGADEFVTSVSICDESTFNDGQVRRMALISNTGAGS